MLSVEETLTERAKPKCCPEEIVQDEDSPF